MEEATLEGVVGAWGERALHLKLLCWKEGAGLEVEIGAGENVSVRTQSLWWGQEGKGEGEGQ